MIITLSGATGNGKNQIISHLIEHGYHVESMKGSDRSLEGQLKLIEEYATKMQELKDDDEIHIFESSFIDILIYTTFLYGIYSDGHEMDIDFEEICIKYQETLVDLNIRLNSSWSDNEDSGDNIGLPVIDMWNMVSEHYSALIECEDVSIGDIPAELFFEIIENDSLQDGSKALEYLSKETLEVMEKYAS